MTKKSEYEAYLLYESDERGGGVAPGQEDEEWPDYNDAYQSFQITGLSRKKYWEYLWSM